MTTTRAEGDVGPRPEGLRPRALLRTHALAASPVVAEFLLMRIIAILATTAPYRQAPLIDPDIKRDVPPDEDISDNRPDHDMIGRCCNRAIKLLFP